MSDSIKELLKLYKEFLEWKKEVGDHNDSNFSDFMRWLLFKNGGTE